MTRAALAQATLILWGAVLLTAPPSGIGPARAANHANQANIASADSTPAPMPDLSIAVPATVPDPGPAASVRPGISRPGLGPTGRSQGYTPHSSYTDSFDGRFHAMPTLNLSVKLQ